MGGLAAVSIVEYQSAIHKSNDALIFAPILLKNRTEINQLYDLCLIIYIINRVKNLYLSAFFKEFVFLPLLKIYRLTTILTTTDPQNSKYRPVRSGILFILT